MFLPNQTKRLGGNVDIFVHLFIIYIVFLSTYSFIVYYCRTYLQILKLII